MDHSGLSTLLTCPRKYQYQNLERLTKSEDSRSLQWGKFWHKVHELWATNKLEPDIVVDLAAQAVEWVDDPDDFRNVERMKQSFLAWLKRWAHQPLRVVDKGAMTEVAFSVELENLNIPGLTLDGMMDAIADIETEEGEFRMIVDYKTTGRLAMDWVGAYRNSNQFRFYYMAARKMGRRVDGVMIDLFHCTKGTKKNPGSGDDFYRQFILFGAEELDEAKNDLYIGLATAELYKGVGHYPKNTTACQAYGRTCPFLDLCLAGPELRERLKEGYDHYDFDPTAKLKEKK
jgi:hypothetical protein